MGVQSIGWQTLSPAEREREYSPSSCIGGNYQPFIKAYAELSAAAWAAHPPVTVAYGDKPANTIDLFVPGMRGGAKTPPPLVVFIHGGYWQELSKEQSAFAALHCLERGMAFAALGYTLAPKARIGEIVAECRAAVAFLASNGAEFGYDDRRIIVTGSSAGAHLGAMVALHERRVRGAVLVSGIYDLQPLVGTSINTALRMNGDEAVKNSPLYQPFLHFPPSVVCWGEIETAQAKAQSRTFAQALRADGASCLESEVPGRNHFDVILDLADPATALGRHLGHMIETV